MSKTSAYRGYADVVRRFDVEPSPGRQRNKFLYAKKRLTTFNAGYVIPFFWMPCLPGDDLSFDVKALIRLSNPLVSPLMDDIWINFHFFKTYNRFVMEDWKPFMGEKIQDNPDYDTSGQNFGGQSMVEPPYVSPDEYELPTIKIPGTKADGTPAFEVHSLLDYLALPYDVGNDGYTSQSLVPRHYNHIYNECYRDENLQQFAPVPKTMGPDSLSQFQLMPSTKYQDYITGSLPFLQKGPNVQIGLTGDVPINYYSDDNPLPSGTTLNLATQLPRYYNADGQPLDGQHGLGYINGYSHGATSASSGNAYSIPALLPAYANLSGTEAVALAQIRLAFQLQRFYEGQARSGTRYIEYIRFMFDEYIPDVQLLRPEFIGGGKIFININPVAQTSNNSTEVSPLATLAAFGVRFTSGEIKARTHCNEHGYILGLLTVGTNLTYQQGLQRDFSKRDRFDFYTPTLAHLAEQPVYNDEVCCTGIPAYDKGVWGYIGRYDEYRTLLGEVTGYFRSNAKVNVGTVENPNYVTATLQSYHLSQFFDVSSPGSEADGFPGLPHLNANFIRQPSDVIDRALNITSSAKGVPQFLGDIVTTCRGVRVVSKYGIPGFADHF